MAKSPGRNLRKRATGISASSRALVPPASLGACARGDTCIALCRSRFLISPGCTERVNSPHGRDNGQAESIHQGRGVASRLFCGADCAGRGLAPAGGRSGRLCQRRLSRDHGLDGGDGRAPRRSQDALAGSQQRRRACHELWPGRRPAGNDADAGSRQYISVYARNRDYHDIIKGKLKELPARLPRERAKT